MLYDIYIFNWSLLWCLTFFTTFFFKNKWATFIFEHVVFHYFFHFCFLNIFPACVLDTTASKTKGKRPTNSNHVVHLDHTFKLPLIFPKTYGMYVLMKLKGKKIRRKKTSIMIYFYFFRLKKNERKIKGKK